MKKQTLEKIPSSNKVSNQENIEIPSFSSKYAIKDLISRNDKHEVFEVISLADNQLYVSKTRSPSCKNLPNLKQNILAKEALILQKLSLKGGFPLLKDFLYYGSQEVLIMSRLGPNLLQLAKDHGGRLSLKSVLMIAIQGISLIEDLHSVNYLHKDIKPENFVIGFDESSSGKIHLIDFGLSTSYLDRDQNHIQLKKKAEVSGNICCLSVFGHLHIEASRRDDLISFGYMLVYLFNGTLPWLKLLGSPAETLKMVQEAKATITYGKLCEGLPEEFVEYFEKAIKTSFYQKPNYGHMRGLFEKAMKKNRFVNDGIFEWNQKSSKKGIDLSGRKMGPTLQMYVKKFNNSEDAIRSPTRGGFL